MFKNYLCIAAIAAATLLPTKGEAQIINTLAGGYNGDGLSAKAIGIKPVGQALDALGNMYIAVPDKHVVMKLSAAGIYTTFAGNGVWGFSGDGGSATAAQLKNPWNVAVDGMGNIFIADNHDNRIRKVTPAGIISTIAGNGLAGFSGDGGAAVSAKINGPVGVVADTYGNVFIADYVNRRVRKVSASGIITTIAGNGTAGTAGDGGEARLAQLGFVAGIAINSIGEIFVADNTYAKIRKVSVSGIITSIAGNGKSGFSGDGGIATAATFNAINSVAADKLGNLFIADTYNYRVRKVNVDGIVSTVAGNGGGAFDGSGDGGAATSAQIYRPSFLAVDALGNILISTNFQIRKVTTGTGIINTIAGNGTGGYCGDGGPTAKAQFYHPVGVFEDSTGNTFLVDRENHRIRKITKTGIITTFAGNGKGGFSGDGSQATTAQLNYPTSVAADAAGNMYITDHGNARIRKVSPTGIITTIAGTGVTGYNGDGPALLTKMFGPDGITVDKSGNILFADQYNMRIRKITPAGTIVTLAGNGVAGFGGDGGPALQASLNWPKDVKIDKAGNLLIADRKNRRIRKITTAGIITTIAGSGSEGYSGDGGQALLAKLDPGSIATDAAGNLYIADTENDCIRKVDAAGVISTIAGKGRIYGDGGLATASQLRAPTAVATNAAGNILITEYENHRIRIISSASSTSMRSSNKAVSSSSSVVPVKFNIYPNPAQNTLNIQTSNAAGLLIVEILDAAGRVRVSQTVRAALPVMQVQVQVKKLTPGLYFIRTVDKKNNIITQQFLKQ
jgi:hypothetical protein